MGRISSVSLDTLLFHDFSWRHEESDKSNGSLCLNAPIHIRRRKTVLKGQSPRYVQLVNSADSKHPMIWIGSLYIQKFCSEITLQTSLKPFSNRVEIKNIKNWGVITEEDKKWFSPIRPEAATISINNLFVAVTSAGSEELLAYLKFSDIFDPAWGFTQIRTGGTAPAQHDDVFACPVVIGKTKDNMYYLLSLASGIAYIPNKELPEPLKDAYSIIPKDLLNAVIDSRRTGLALFHIHGRISSGYLIELLAYSFYQQEVHTFP